MKSYRLTLSAFVALAAMLCVSPAAAQGKGQGNGKNDRQARRSAVRTTGGTKMPARRVALLAVYRADGARVEETRTIPHATAATAAR